ncbi:PelD GGDEF domain-containing protein [Marinobacter sp.]|uniref:PelD GGDEF domain-containing protein n=1 Tax=Marinobacter sp. TaxID=50741 RepID=UPI002B269975|nr:PelD GGDEF domain-containing protein [Marinobacter sp.]
MTKSDVHGDLSLSSKETAVWVKWLETILMTLLFIAAGLWLNPENPLFIGEAFPWPVLAALGAGLRYGFMMALVSSSLIFTAAGLMHRAGFLPGDPLPYTWGVGVLTTGLLAGEFRDYWDRRIEKLIAANQYRHVRLEEFTRNFYLLKVSHDRLEQQLAGNSNSLREALRRLYSEISHARGTGLNPETGALVMRLLVRYGQLQIAAIYPINDGVLAQEPVATVGSGQPLNPDDPLLVHALEQRTLVSVHTEYRDNRGDLDTQLLLALPLIDSEQHMVGIVTVEAMPFFSFQPKTLRLLAIMSGHMTDILLEHSQISGQVQSDWRHFLFQLARVTTDARDHQLPSTLVHFAFNSAASATHVHQMMQQTRRGLDVITQPPGAADTQIVVLLPLTDELGTAAYLQRLADAVQLQSGRYLESFARIQQLSLGDKIDPSEWLDRQQKEPA